jgi:hypothetical protein
MRKTKENWLISEFVYQWSTAKAMVVTYWNWAISGIKNQ